MTRIYELQEPACVGETQKKGKVQWEVLYNNSRQCFLKCPWKHCCPGDKIQVHGAYCEWNN